MIGVNLHGDGTFPLRIRLAAGPASPLPRSGPFPIDLAIRNGRVIASHQGGAVGELAERDGDLFGEWIDRGTLFGKRLSCPARVQSSSIIEGEPDELALDLPLAAMADDLRATATPRRRRSDEAEPSRRQTSDLGWCAAIFLITLVTAIVGSYLGVSWYASEVAQRLGERMGR